MKRLIFAFLAISVVCLAAVVFRADTGRAETYRGTSRESTANDFWPNGTSSSSPTCTGDFNLATDGACVAWLSASQICGGTTIGDGLIRLTDTAGTAGVTLEVVGSSTIKCRNLGDSNECTIQGNIGEWKGNVEVGNDDEHCWSSTNSGLTGDCDTGLERVQAGVVAATDGALGNGDFQLGFYTADPCGTLPEGTIWYNDTSDYMCFCSGAGADLQVHNPAVACF